VILVDAMPGGGLNFDADIRTLTELRKGIKRVWLHKNPTKTLLQNENARPHTFLKTREIITKFGWTVLHHPPHSPDLAPSDFHLFGALKDIIRGTKFGTDDVICIVRTWLHGQDKAWY
jgi:histone-lysine N-methyltransferase SETMAR